MWVSLHSTVGFAAWCGCFIDLAFSLFSRRWHEQTLKRSALNMHTSTTCMCLRGIILVRGCCFRPYSTDLSDRSSPYALQPSVAASVWGSIAPERLSALLGLLATPEVLTDATSGSPASLLGERYVVQSSVVLLL